MSINSLKNSAIKPVSPAVSDTSSDTKSVTKLVALSDANPERQSDSATVAHSALFSAIVPAPFGYIGVRTEAGAIIELVYLPERFTVKPAQDAMAELAERQIAAYFKDPEFQFSLILKPAGTAFQQRVWSVIAAIPCGQVLSYGQVAKLLKTAPRAVGQACGANPYPLIVPCHRVTAAAGLGGFAHHDDVTGFHVGVKRCLLAHENCIVKL